MAPGFVFDKFFLERFTAALSKSTMLPNSMHSLEVINISKSFDCRAIPAFKDLNFSLEKGRVLALFGPSGTGKSTLLKMIAGELLPDSGEIKLSGRVELVKSIHEVDNEKTLTEIIGELLHDFPMERQIQRKRELVDLFSLYYKDQQTFKTLSLGEQKRALLARSLAPFPSVLLLDEPFSSLDLILKNEIKNELRQICLAENISTLFVSHNFQDIMSFSDRVAVLDVGQIRQIDLPAQIYDFPRDAHVAKLIQHSCLLACEILSLDNNLAEIKTKWGKFQISKIHSLITKDTKRANLLIYPNEFELAEIGIEAKVLALYPHGPFLKVVLSYQERSFIAQISNSVIIEIGQKLVLKIKTEEIRLIPL
jgi:ABC-type Fe3+/spermidine/putrescine transport system ATPase subunit